MQQNFKELTHFDENYELLFKCVDSSAFKFDIFSFYEDSHWEALLSPEELKSVFNWSINEDKEIERVMNFLHNEFKNEFYNVSRNESHLFLNFYLRLIDSVTIEF